MGFYMKKGRRVSRPCGLNEKAMGGFRSTHGFLFQ